MDDDLVWIDVLIGMGIGVVLFVEIVVVVFGFIICVFCKLVEIVV